MDPKGLSEMTPKISVLLASYGPQSQRYLNLCYKSLEAQTFKEFEVIHVSSGDYRPIAGGIVKLHRHFDERLHFPAAINKAYELSNKESEVILLLNDDVIMQKHCVEMLYQTAMCSDIIVNPKSNCDDNGRFYVTAGKFNRLQYRIDEMESLYSEVIDFNNDHQSFLIVGQHQVHFYCTAMKRKIWDHVGGIDSQFLTGFDDKDFCLRAKSLGYPSVIAFHAYALHGSGVSADIHLTPQDRNFNAQYFYEKHK